MLAFLTTTDVGRTVTPVEKEDEGPQFTTFPEVESEASGLEDEEDEAEGEGDGRRGGV